MEKKLLKQNKKQMLKNIISLRDTLNTCLDAGLVDYESVFYNQLEELEEEIHTSEDLNALRELVIQAQSFEKQLCMLYDTAGLSTTNLDWPNIEEIQDRI